MVRPENVVILRDDDVRPTNVLKARVVDVTDLGTDLYIVADLASGRRLTVRDRDRSRARPAPNDCIQLYFKPETMQFFNEPTL